jgi:excisionase family DNA binding protein
LLKGGLASLGATLVAMASEEEILTISELSAHLRVHPTTIYRLLREGRIPGFRVGSAWRFSRTAIEKWERGQVGPLEGRSLPLRLPKGRKARK